jgi:hypothetical protein
VLTVQDSVLLAGVQPSPHGQAGCDPPKFCFPTLRLTLGFADCGAHACGSQEWGSRNVAVEEPDRLAAPGCAALVVRPHRQHQAHPQGPCPRKVCPSNAPFSFFVRPSQLNAGMRGRSRRTSWRGSFETPSTFHPVRYECPSRCLFVLAANMAFVFFSPRDLLLLFVLTPMRCGCQVQSGHAFHRVADCQRLAAAGKRQPLTELLTKRWAAERVAAV